MKISKLLNKNYLSIFVISTFFLFSQLNAEEDPIDIWDLDQKVETDNNQQVKEKNKIITNSIIQIETTENLKKENLDPEIIKLAGLYDPEENGLSIDMWINSDGNEIESIFEKINKIELSKDAKDILNIILLTNSYFPIKNISEEKFLSF